MIHNVHLKLAMWPGTEYKFSNKVGAQDTRPIQAEAGGEDYPCPEEGSKLYLSARAFWQVIHKAGWPPSLEEALACLTAKIS